MQIDPLKFLLPVIAQKIQQKRETDFQKTCLLLFSLE